METLAEDLRTMIRTPLADSHVAAMRLLAHERTYAPGDMILRHGEPMTHFLYLLEGEAEALDPQGNRYGNATLGPTQFVGEVSFLNNSHALLGQRAVTACRFLAVPRAQMLDLMAQIPELSDIVVTVFAARRRRMLESHASNLTLIGADQDREIRKIAAFATRNRIPFRSLDLQNPETAQIAARCDLHARGPAVIFGADTVVEDPNTRKVARLLGIDLDLDPSQIFDVIIVGGGPAGIAAGVYAGAEGLSALVLEDLTIGGQAGASSRIENYMGFPTGISGADLCWRGELQAMKFGTRFAVPRRATALEHLDGGLACVHLDDGARVCARAVVIATGVQYRRLPVPRLPDFEGAGIFYAATELEARYCKQSEVVVIGGGNSAGQAAMFLSRAARHVHVLVRGASLADSMSSYLSERLDKDPAITVHFHSEIAALHGDDALDAVTILDRARDRAWRLPTCNVFVMVGAAPNTAWLPPTVALDPQGFVLTGPAAGGRSPFETSARGVFAVGDVRAGSTKRVAAGVGEGSVVISKVWEHVRLPQTT